MFNGTPKDPDLKKEPGRLYEGIEYKEFWISDSRKKLNLLERELIRKLIPKKGRRIIDLGSGFGRLADCYIDRFDQVVLLDGSMSLLRQAKNDFKKRATYIAADINNIPFAASSFDCILMMRVFHHIENSERLIQSFNRIMINGGTLIFNYSNKLNPNYMLRWMRGKTTGNPFTQDTVGIGSTFIQHHPHAVSSMLAKNGFHIKKYWGAGVVDKFPKPFRADNLNHKFSTFLAPILGSLKIAPWMICHAQMGGKVESELLAEIDNILVCPICKGVLIINHQSYRCQSCDKTYPIVDGIPDFRI